MRTAALSLFTWLIACGAHDDGQAPAGADADSGGALAIDCVAGYQETVTVLPHQFGALVRGATDSATVMTAGMQRFALLERQGMVIFQQQRTDGSWRIEDPIPLTGANLKDGPLLAISGDLAVAGGPSFSEENGFVGYLDTFARTNASWRAVDTMVLDRGDSPNAIALRGDTLAVAGTEFEPSQPYVEIFRWNNEHWTSAFRLSLPEQHTVRALALTDASLLVGVPRGFTDPESGRVLIYDRASSPWQLTGAIESPPGVVPNDVFGLSLSVSGATLAVGAPNHDGARTSSGAVHIFEQGGAGEWTATDVLEPSGPSGRDRFGESVALGPDRLIIARMGGAHRYRRGAGGEWVEDDLLRFAGDQAEQLAIGRCFSVVGSRASDAAPAQLRVWWH